MLRAVGTRIVDGVGKPVYLHGTNFGSWLLVEPWIPNMYPPPRQMLLSAARALGHEEPMRQALAALPEGKGQQIWALLAPVKEEYERRAGEGAAAALEQELRRSRVHDEHSLWALLERRFGRRKMEELRQGFRRSWITEADVLRVKHAGLNLVRVPFWYRLLEDDERPGRYRAEGWRWLDAVVGWCRKHSVYCLLDMHGTPGGQNDAGHSGQGGRSELWQSESFRRRTVALWRAIARRYAREEAVAGYDLMNEPWGAATPMDLHDFHDRLYRAVREVDPHHLVFMEEAYKGLWTFPDPAARGWQNVVYSIHFYLQGATGLGSWEAFVRYQLPQWHLLAESYGVPLFVGEFCAADEATGGAAAMDLLFREFGRYGFHWAPWTFKKVDAGPPYSLWGLYRWEGEWRGMDLASDSLESIQEAFARYDTAHMLPHAAYLEAVKRNAGRTPDKRLLDRAHRQAEELIPRLRVEMAKPLTEEEVERALELVVQIAPLFAYVDGKGVYFLESGPFFFELFPQVPPEVEAAIKRAFGSVAAFSSVWMRLSAGTFFVPRSWPRAIEAGLTVAPETVAVLTRMKPRIDQAAARIAGMPEGSTVDVTQP